MTRKRLRSSSFTANRYESIIGFLSNHGYGNGLIHPIYTTLSNCKSYSTPTSPPLPKRKKRCIFGRAVLEILLKTFLFYLRWNLKHWITCLRKDVPIRKYLTWVFSKFVHACIIFLDAFDFHYSYHSSSPKAIQVSCDHFGFV